MSKFVHHEIERLERRLLRLCGIVEESVQNAVRACREGDKGLALQVVDNDAAIDSLEVFIEEECLKMLALYQPVAVDLRFVVAALKINNDLERVGDMAVNIAKAVKTMGELPGAELGACLGEMGEKAANLLRLSLDAFMKQDGELAGGIRAMDKEVDALYRRVAELVESALDQPPGGSRHTLLQVLLVARALERVADHAKNIAEDTLYMLEGEIVRHRAKATATPVA